MSVVRLNVRLAQLSYDTITRPGPCTHIGTCRYGTSYICLYRTIWVGCNFPATQQHLSNLWLVVWWSWRWNRIFTAQPTPSRPSLIHPQWCILPQDSMRGPISPPRQHYAPNEMSEIPSWDVKPGWSLSCCVVELKVMLESPLLWHS